jgi:hypothetical protein
MSAMAQSPVERLTQRSQRPQRSDKVLKDFKKWDGRKSIGADKLSYFLRDPLSDLRDLCVNLCSFGLSRMS